MKIPEKLRSMCFNELATVKFLPGLQDKKEYMNVAEELNDFNEWCISEKSLWGLPVPYFEHNLRHDRVLSNEEITRHVADIFRQQGSDAWYKLPVKDLLPPSY